MTSLQRKRKQHATSPIELILDGKTLTDQGVAILGPALYDALRPPPGEIVARLQVLHLQSNALTAKCLKHLAPALRVACPDLELLDLSDNYIGVDSADAADSWEQFLLSLGPCANLRLVNLSKNNFDNSRAAEIFARVYMKQFKVAIGVYKSYVSSNTGTDDDDSNPDAAGLDDSMATLSVRDTNVVRSKTADVKNVSTSPCKSRVAPVTGLPSIAVFDMSDSFLGDNGALFLSWVVERHRWIQNHVFDREWSGSGADNAMLFVIPNEKLNAHGTQLIKQAMSTDYSPPGVSIVDAEAEADQDAEEDWEGQAASKYTVENLKSVRKTARSHSIPGPNATGDAPHTDFDTGAAHASYTTGSLEWLRTRIQRDVIESQGLKHVELWHTAIKLLCAVRATLVSPHNEYHTPSPTRMRKASSTVQAGRPSSAPQPNQELPEDMEWPALPTMQAQPSKSPSSVSKLLIKKMTPMTPVADEMPELRRHSSRKSPGRLSGEFMSSSQHGRIPSGEKKRRMAMKRAGEKIQMAGALPATAVFRSLCKAIDPSGLLSERQRLLVLEYGQDRNTLAAEMEMLGKSKSHQLWAVLEHMDVLCYEDGLEDVEAEEQA